MVHAYSMQPISHPHSVIKATSPKVSIVFNNPVSGRMKMWTELLPHRGGRQLTNRVMLYAIKDNEVTVDVCLPGRGSYSLKILGEVLTPNWPNEGKADVPVERLFWYKIDYDGAGKSDSFIPSRTGAEWGMTAHFQAAGFELIYPESPVIETKDGMCQIQMQLPTFGVFPTFHRLHHDSANTSQLQSCVYGEKTGNFVTYYIRCPYQGEYRFEIYYLPQRNTTGSGHYNGAAFLIQCKETCKDAFCYTASEKLGGPLPVFYARFGLRAETSDSTVKLRDGKADLTFQKTRPVKLFATLQAGKGKSTSVKETNTDDATTFHIEASGEGFHFFKLYACEANENSGPLVATYCFATNELLGILDCRWQDEVKYKRLTSRQHLTTSENRKVICI